MLPHSPPLPLGATISGATGEVIVTFDRPLKVRAGLPANWTVQADRGPGPLFHTPQAPVAIAGTTVTFPTVPAGITFPPLGVDYAATPPNVETLPGVPAAPFVDLPIVRIL